MFRTAFVRIILLNNNCERSVCSDVRIHPDQFLVQPHTEIVASYYFMFMVFRRLLYTFCPRTLSTMDSSWLCILEKRNKGFAVKSKINIISHNYV